MKLSKHSNSIACMISSKVIDTPWELRDVTILCIKQWPSGGDPTTSKMLKNDSLLITFSNWLECDSWCEKRYSISSKQHSKLFATMQEVWATDGWLSRPPENLILKQAY